jgi:hypothetical protein
MSSSDHFDFASLPYSQRLQAVLYNPLLPHNVELGMYNYTAGKYVKQEGFRSMSGEEIQRLAFRLQSQQRVSHLNLYGHSFGPEGMRLLAAPIATQASLKALYLCST